MTFANFVTSEISRTDMNFSYIRHQGGGLGRLDDKGHLAIFVIRRT